MRKINLAFILLLFLIPHVSANLIVTWADYLINPISILFILIIEVVGFWLLANKVFKINVSFWKSLLIIFVANIITSLLGIFIYFINLSFAYQVLIAFILSFLIEFVVYLLFFINKQITKINLFYISVIVNLLSYVSILFLPEVLNALD